MKNQAKQIREIRNKHFKPKLEFGCEVSRHNAVRRKDDIFIFINNKKKDEFGRIQCYLGKKNGQSIAVYFDYELEILGKPTTYNEILRMLPKGYQIFSDGSLWEYMGYGEFREKEHYFIDLTKEIEDQKPEVLDKIIKMLI